MFCCVGLIGGMAVGQFLGDPWTYIAPAAGFGIGLVADVKFMGNNDHGGGRHDIKGAVASERIETAAQSNGIPLS